MNPLLALSLPTLFSSSPKMAVPDGTVIKLRIERTLSTRPEGGFLHLVGAKPASPTATRVEFLVDRDVLDADGNVLIEEGATAFGSVVQCKPSGGIRAHSPSLAVSVDSVTAADGSVVPLHFANRVGSLWAHSFTRSETAGYKQATETRIPRLPEPVLVLSVADLRHATLKGGFSEPIHHPSELFKLQYFAQRCGFSPAARAVQLAELLALAQAFSDIVSGRFELRTLGDAVRALDVMRLVGDAAKTGHEFGAWVGGRVDPPQIVVPAGFPLEAVVAE
jgi:hypothetical protein